MSKPEQAPIGNAGTSPKSGLQSVSLWAWLALSIIPAFAVAQLGALFFISTDAEAAVDLGFVSAGLIFIACQIVFVGVRLTTVGTIITALGLPLAIATIGHDVNTLADNQSGTALTVASDAGGLFLVAWMLCALLPIQRPLFQRH